jgi:hypothetical protein
MGVRPIPDSTSGRRPCRSEVIRGTACLHAPTTPVNESHSGAPNGQVNSTGWFRASRYPQMPELVKSSRTAFVLAYALAYRARWNDAAFNPFNLQPGEAICDYLNWGLSEQEFRNARDKLKEWGFATFRATNKGTVGKLVDMRLFSVLLVESNEQRYGHSNGPAATGATDKERPEQRHTKSKEQKSRERKSLKGSPHGNSKGRLATTRLVKRPTKKEFWAYANSKEELDGDWVEEFLKMRRRDNDWKNWRSRLPAFCKKLESDRKGTR